MTERLTDEHLREMLDRHANVRPPSVRLAIEELRALRARVAKLEAALEEIARLSPSARARRTAERALKDAPQ
jgi:hypothetical protein